MGSGRELWLGIPCHGNIGLERLTVFFFVVKAVLIPQRLQWGAIYACGNLKVKRIETNGLVFFYHIPAALMEQFLIHQQHGSVEVDFST